jgi:hypothetical protein
MAQLAEDSAPRAELISPWHQRLVDHHVTADLPDGTLSSSPSKFVTAQ